MENSEVSLKEYWLILSKHRRLVAFIAIGVFLVTAISSFLSPNVYQAQTSFYYPLSDKGHSLGNIAQSVLGKDDTGLGSMLLPSSGGNLQDYSRGILESRHIADALSAHLNLKERFHIQQESRIAQLLHDMTQVKLSNDGIMEITVTTTNPQLSADIANGYVDVFRDYSLTSLMSVSKKHRIDVEKRLAQLREKLQDAESDVSVFQRTHKTTDFMENGRNLMRSLLELQSDKLSTDIALRSMEGTLQRARQVMVGELQDASRDPLVSPRLMDPILDGLNQQLSEVYVKYSQAKVNEKPENPELVSYAQQIKDLESALQKEIRHHLQAESTGATGDFLDMQIKVAQLEAKDVALTQGINQTESKFNTYPQINLQYGRKARRLKILETLYLFLSTEYEKARLEEARESPDFEVLDKAAPPDHKSGPHRLFSLIFGLFLGLFLGAGAAFFVESMKPNANTKLPPDGHLTEPELEMVETGRR